MKRLLPILLLLLLSPFLPVYCHGQVDATGAIAGGASTPTAAPPTFSPIGGTYPNPITVTLSTSSTGCGAYIYWATHNPPTTGDNHGTSVSVGATENVYAKVIGCAGFNDSAVGAASYTIGATGPLLCSGVMPAEGCVDWTLSGIPGGVPTTWTQQGSTINASACSNGSVDCTSTIQTALNGCGTNHYILLGVGTFLINTFLNFPSNCYLLGSGMGTILNVKGSSTAPIMMGSGGVAFTGSLSLVSGNTQGSTVLGLSGTTGVGVGKYLVVTENNDNVTVDVRGGEGNCTWCDGWTADGHLASGQIVEVTGVSGTNVTISPPLYRAYTNTPIVVPFAMQVKYAGIQNLQIYDNATGYQRDVNMSMCAYCWVKYVEFNYTQGDYVDTYWSFRGEIRDSYMSNAYTHTSGSADNDISLLYKTTGMLVENNIIERPHAAILLSWGAAGNVIGYNYAQGGLDQNSQNFAIGGMGMHGAHPQFNLWEGNVTPSISPDQIWGSSAYNTMYRNWAEGATISCLPLTGRGTVSCSPFGQYGASGVKGWAAFQASRAIVLSHLATHYFVIGNVAGSAAQNALLAYGNPTTHVAMLQYPSTQSYDSTNYNMTFGYGESSDSGSGTGCAGSTNPPCHSTNAYNTAFLHGNYTYADNTVRWASGWPMSIPPSLYHSTTPTWWHGLTWPPTGPDVSGGSEANGYHYPIPAENCYKNIMGGTEGGPGSPLSNFNPLGCY